MNALRGRGRIAAALALAFTLAALAATPLGRRLSGALARTHATRSELSSARLTRLLARSGELIVQPPGAALLARPVRPEEVAPEGRCPELELAGRSLPPTSLPSSTSAPEPWRTAGPPLLSLWLDPCRFARVHSRPWKPGRDTEETGWVSFFEGGELRFAAPAAVRIHGGVSRRYAPYGYRLSFRSEHGTAGLPGSLVDPELRDPLARFVVSEFDDEDSDGGLWAFPGEVAYEIGRRVGALAPRTRPLWLSLNGAPAAIYSLSEHIDEDYFRRHFGHDRFEFHRGKRHPDDPRAESEESDRFWAAEMAWIANAPAPLERDTVNARYDVDSLTAWLLTVLFNGTGDLYQEAIFRDRSGEFAGGRWSFVLWDLDMSFRTPPRNSRFGSKRDVLPYVLDTERTLTAPQQAMVQRLVDENPAYREEIVARTTRALNHLLTPAYLEGLVTKYERIARTLGVTEFRWAGRLRDFFADRPSAVRAQLQKMLGAGSPIDVEVHAPAGTITVDGFPVDPGYRGIYPAGTILEAEVAPEARSRFVGWEIATTPPVATPVGSPSLRFTVWGPSTVVARFRD